MIESHPIETRPVNTTAGAKMNTRLFLPLPGRDLVKRQLIEVLTIRRIKLDQHFLRISALVMPDMVRIRGPVPGAALLGFQYKLGAAFR